MERFLVKKPRLEVDQSNKDSEEADPSSSSVPSTSATTSPPSLTPVVVSSVGNQKLGKKRTFQKSWLLAHSWIEWNSQIDKVFCKICKEAEAKSLVTFSSKKEDAFTTVGFSNWKNARERFKSHENSHSHKESAMKIFAKQNVAVLLDDQLNKDMKLARSAMLCIFTTVKFLCRQGIAIRGHDDICSNFWQLLNLRKEDRPDLAEWLGRSGYKWTSHDVQNEIIGILGQSVLRSVIQEIKDCNYFGIMVDETSDISVQEQVTFCIRTVNENFDICEDFLGFYAAPNTEAKTLFDIVKDILARFGLSLDNLRGQCYDGAAQMKGRFKGLQTRIKEIQPQALYVHCAAHSLSLAVEDSLRQLSCMRDIMNLAKDLINTIRESPKRMDIFKTILGNDKTGPTRRTGLRPLCPTRWTMRASSLNQILKKYSSLIECFDLLSQNDTSDAAAKCSGYLEQMTLFKTFWFLSLYSLIMSPVEEINSQIQSEHIGAAEVKDKLGLLTNILEEKRGKFNQFWKTCNEEKPSLVDEPILPRHRRLPKKLDNPGCSEAHTFSTPEEYFKRVYNEVCDTVLMCVKERFQQSGLNLVSAVEEECVSVMTTGSNKTQKIRELFCGDLDQNRLLLHLTMLNDIAKQRNISLSSMRDVRKFLEEEKSVKDLLPEVTKCIKLLRTVPVTTATAERSFSCLRRLKNYLRGTMGQERLNYIAILNCHQEVLDRLDMRPLVNEFINKNNIRKASIALF